MANFVLTSLLVLGVTTFAAMGRPQTHDSFNTQVDESAAVLPPSDFDTLPSNLGPDVNNVIQSIRLLLELLRNECQLWQQQGLTNLPTYCLSSQSLPGTSSLDNGLASGSQTNLVLPSGVA